MLTHCVPDGATYFQAVDRKLSPCGTTNVSQFKRRRSIPVVAVFLQHIIKYYVGPTVISDPF